MMKKFSVEWYEKLETITAKMREKAAIKFGKDWVGARFTPEAQKKGLDKCRTLQRAKGNAHRNNIVEVSVSEPTTRLRNLKNVPEVPYPKCQRCNNSPGTIRAGFANGIQRYRCVYCRGTFTGPIIVIKLEPCDYKIICYHCGSANTNRLGRGMSKSRTGRLALCNNCNRKFVQGGLHDLQKYHLVLEERIANLHVPEDVQSEILQMAYVDVLAGKGYSWSVELKIKEAWRNARGEYGQKGSDHPQFRLQAGQKMYDD